MSASDEMVLALVAASVAEANGFPNTAKALVELAMQIKQGSASWDALESKAMAGANVPQQSKNSPYRI
jgi:hypothetical protein